MTVNALDIGKAAEYLVCADLLLAGYVAFPSDQGLPYDVVLDGRDGRLLRLQVRSTQSPKNCNARGRTLRSAYSFQVRRRGKGGSANLTTHQCDLIALVALDIKVIAYLPLKEAAQTIQLLPPGCVAKNRRRAGWHAPIDSFPVVDAIKRLDDVEPNAFVPMMERDLIEYRGQKNTLGGWSSVTGLSPATISTRLSRGWTVEDALTKRLNRPPKPLLTANGKSQTVEVWAREIGVKPGTLYARRRAGWPDEQVVNTPIQNGVDARVESENAFLPWANSEVSGDVAS